jgi:hypothetical protein
LSFEKKKGGDSDDSALGIENGRTAGAFGNRSRNLEHVSFFPWHFSSGRNNSFGKRSLEPKGTSDDGDSCADLGGPVGGDREVGEVFAVHLKESEIVGNIGGEDFTDREKPAIFCLGDDHFGIGDDMVIGDEPSIGRDKKPGA